MLASVTSPDVGSRRCLSTSPARSPPRRFRGCGGPAPTTPSRYAADAPVAASDGRTPRVLGRRRRARRVEAGTRSRSRRRRLARAHDPAASSAPGRAWTPTCRPPPADDRPRGGPHPRALRISQAVRFLRTSAQAEAAAHTGARDRLGTGLARPPYVATAPCDRRGPSPRTRSDGAGAPPRTRSRPDPGQAVPPRAGPRPVPARGRIRVAHRCQPAGGRQPGPGR